MTTYGSVLYGYRTYSAGIDPVTTEYVLQIDWNNDGTWITEGSRILNFRVSRGRNSLISGDAYTPTDSGSFSITLDNYDRRYDPFYEAGPLYGHIKPNRKMRLYAIADLVGSPVFTGWIRKITNESKSKVTRIEGYDGIDSLRDQANPLSSTLWLNEDVSTIIEEMIVASGWTGGYLIEDASPEDQIGLAFLDSGKSFWGQLCEIADAFLADIFVSADGKIKYFTRTRNPATTLTLNQNEMSKDISLEQPWDEIINDETISVYPIILSSTGVEMYNHGDKTFVGSGETVTVFGNYSISSKSAILTGALTVSDKHAFANADGTGGELTAYLTVTPTGYATTVKLVLTNSHPSSGLYVTTLKLTGQGYYMGEPTYIKLEDLTSQAEYGKFSMSQNAVWMQNSIKAYDMAAYTLQVLDEARRVPHLTVIERPELQFGVDLYDFVELVINTLDIGGPYRITRIEHTYDSPRGCTTTWRVEPTMALTLSGWKIGTSKLGTETYLV